MPSISQPRPAPEFDTSRKSQVINITEARTFAVIWTDAEGQKSMCLAISFGKDAEAPNPDKAGPGVFILADQEQMTTDLTIANKIVKAGVQKHLAQEAPATADEVPAGLSTIEIEEPMETPEDEEASEDNPLAGILP